MKYKIEIRFYEKDDIWKCVYHWATVKIVSRGMLYSALADLKLHYPCDTFRVTFGE